MPYTSFLSRRYLRAGRATPFLSFIVIVAIAGITLGTAALNVALSVIYGFETQLRANIVTFIGEIEVQDFQSRPLPHYRAALKTMRDSVPGVRAVSAFAARQVIVRTPLGVEGVMLKGIDAATDVSRVRSHMAAGTFAFPALPNGTIPLVLGKRLAEKLGCAMGDSLVIFPLNTIPGMDASVALFRGRVVGVYETGFAQYDDIFVYTAIGDAQRVFDLSPDAASGFDVVTTGTDSLPRVAQRIEEAMGYPYYAVTMYERHPDVFAWIELQKEPVPVVMGLIIIVAAFNCVATLLMIVLEKTHAIGILKTLGATRRDIRRIFLVQGAFIGVTGVVLGDLLGFGLCWLQQTYHVIHLKADIYFMSSAPIDMRPEAFIMVSVIAFVLCVVATAVPAQIASRLLPLKALKFG